MRIALAMVSLLLSGVVAAETCETLAAKYADQDKQISLIFKMGVGDNSAARETNRQVETANALMRKQMLIVYMQAAKCPLPKIFEQKFMSAAVACVLSPPDSKYCDMSTWQPDVQ
jgi:hypothetical protein